MFIESRLVQGSADTYLRLNGQKKMSLCVVRTLYINMQYRAIPHDMPNTVSLQMFLVWRVTMPLTPLSLPSIANLLIFYIIFPT